MKILDNFFIKTIGIIAVLYFTLFSDKEDTDNLRNRFSSEQLKQDVSTIVNNTQHILTNAKQVKKHGLRQIKNTARCGNEVIINYKIFSLKSKKELESVSNLKIVISDKTDIFNSQIIGMKKNEVKTFEVLKNQSINDARLVNYLKNSENGLSLHIELLEVSDYLAKTNC